MDVKDYTIEEHIHRFAVWTAARAASRGRLKNTKAEFLMNKIRLRQKVEELRHDVLLDDTSYRIWIKENCEEICRLVAEKNWSDYKTTTFRFGVAAKIISIYIKTVEVIPSKGSSILAEVAYPPIDSILLQNLNRKHGLKLKTTWSTFKWPDYEEKINLLNQYYPAIPKWKIEVEWKVSNEEDSIPPES